MMDRDLARLEFHFLAFTGHLIGFASLDLDRRIRGRGLFDLTDKGLQHFLELLLCHIDRLIIRSHFSFGVKRICPAAQPDNGLVALVGCRYIFAQTDSRSH